MADTGHDQRPCTVVGPESRAKEIHAESGPTLEQEEAMVQFHASIEQSGKSAESHG